MKLSKLLVFYAVKILMILLIVLKRSALNVIKEVMKLGHAQRLIS